MKEKYKLKYFVSKLPRNKEMLTKFPYMEASFYRTPKSIWEAGAKLGCKETDCVVVCIV
jgi:hypothetical protein